MAWARRDPSSQTWVCSPFVGGLETEACFASQGPQPLRD